MTDFNFILTICIVAVAYLSSIYLWIEFSQNSND